MSHVGLRSFAWPAGTGSCGRRNHRNHEILAARGQCLGSKQWHVMGRYPQYQYRNVSSNGRRSSGDAQRKSCASVALVTQVKSTPSYVIHG
jgi:hypothetical protein